MQDYFELDFLSVDSDKSGDAITIRYVLNEVTRIQVVDGCFQDTGDKIVSFIKEYYGTPDTIDAVVLTHPDGDHAGGLQKVLEEFDVGTLWMLRPWTYVKELFPRFSRYTSSESLVKRLKEVYPNVAALEEIAEDRNIPILEPFQGAIIGDFCVLAPTKARYLDLVVDSEKTPAVASAEKTAVSRLIEKVISYIRAVWGAETLAIR